MSIGYACIALYVADTDQKSCRLENATPERIRQLIGHNLSVLDRILDYNSANHIRLFRISSDMIPFGSNKVNQICWWEEFGQELSALGDKIKENKIRVSMHPGQYTVINSKDPQVVKHSVEDLVYHERFLSSLGVDSSHKLILHIGGVYGDKKSAMERFCQAYEQLPEAVKSRLVIENDQRSYTIEDVLEIGKRMNIPVVYDELHHKVNPANEEKDWVKCCSDTWGIKDGTQKVHYSIQDEGKKLGAHSETIFLHDFVEFYEKYQDYQLDIMLEVKDKNLSAVKCILGTAKKGKIANLEVEWGKYKYKILENSPSLYNSIRQLLKDKRTYPVLEFYQRIEQGILTQPSVGTAINGAQHVWGYFSDQCTDEEKARFIGLIIQYEEGTISISKVKSFLWKLTEKYQESYLLNSYYFK